MNGTLRIWLIGISVMLAVGVPLQLLLWWHEDRSVTDALAQGPVLWGLYLFAGALVGEHLRNVGTTRRGGERPDRS